jgi:hypothetical protein
MSSRFNKFASRFGTKSAHSKKDVERSLPHAQDDSPVIQETTKQRASANQDSNATDDKIAKDQDIESQDDKIDAKPTSPSTSKVVDNVKSVRTKPVSTPTKGPYNMLWSSVLDYKFLPRRFAGISEFIPNAIPLDQMLRIALPLVSRSNWIQKNEITFNPYAVALGYFYLYYLQILRARMAASELTGQEASALSRIQKYVSFETIPVPGFLIPFYESIVSTLLDDVKFKWIVPSWGLLTNADWPNYADFESTAADTAINYVRPNIPFMVANLVTFGCNDRTTIANHMTASRVFEPTSLKTATNAPKPDLRLMGVDVDVTDNALTNPIRALGCCGASFPFQFWNDNYPEVVEEFQNSDFFVRNGPNLALTNSTGVTGGALYRNPNTGRNTVETLPFQKIDQYLFIAKENNPSWFKYCVSQMEIFCRHFPTDVTTFEKLATTGGMESTILAQLKFEDPITAGGNDYVYADRSLGLAQQRNQTWYPNRFRHMSATFQSNRADTERPEQLQALALAINANPPVTSAATDHFRRGKFFEQSAAAVDQVEFIGSMDLDQPGIVPMYNDFDVGYIRELFIPKPDRK